MTNLSSEATGSTQNQQEKITSSLIAVTIFIILVIPAVVIAADLKSGIYENLALAVAPNGTVIGRYEESQGEGVSKNCSFFLRGKSRNGEATVITWSDHVLSGIVKAVKGGVDLKVAKGTEHAGCGLVLLPQISDGLALDLVRQTKWLDLVRITTERAVLHTDPSGSGETRGFLHKGTTVGVITRRNGWLLVESIFQQKAKSGWIRESEAKQPKPPLPQ